MEKIQEYALHMDWDMAFEGKSRGNRHLFRVNQLAKYLQKMEGGDRDVIIAAAWLHDIGLVHGNANHCFKGAKMARNFLGELGIDYDTIMRIVHCIEAHDGEIEARSLEAKVVHDADTLDKMGPLGIVRQTWKLLVLNAYTVEELLDVLPSHLQKRRDNLYLYSSVALADRHALIVRDFFEDRAGAARVLHYIGKLAKNGLPTENVVESMRNEGLLTEEFSNALEEQLLLTFL